MRAHNVHPIQVHSNHIEIESLQRFLAWRCTLVTNLNSKYRFVERKKRGENEREEGGGPSFKHSSTESMLPALFPTVSKKKKKKKTKKRQNKKERKIGTFIKKKFTRLLNGGNNAKASSRRFP